MSVPQVTKPGPRPEKTSTLFPALAQVVRAAIKAGVKPKTVARQFGVSLAAIQKSAIGDGILIMADQPDETTSPVTLGDLVQQGRLLWCDCRGYEREVDPRALGLSDAQPAPTVGTWLRGSQCGSPETETSPQRHFETLEVIQVRCRTSPRELADYRRRLVQVGAWLTSNVPCFVIPPSHRF